MPELHAFVNDKKLSIPKLKRKDGASDTLARGLQNHSHHAADLIAAIVKLPEFTLVSKSTIEEIVEKVGFQPLKSHSKVDHFALPAQIEEGGNKATRRTSLVYARDCTTRCTFSTVCGGGDFFSNIHFTYTTSMDLM